MRIIPKGALPQTIVEKPLCRLVVVLLSWMCRGHDV